MSMVRKEELWRIRVFGIVQGVGFRPTVSRHADACHISGNVSNVGPYVEILARGLRTDLKAFRDRIESEPPKRAVILKMIVEEMEPPELFDQDFDGFSIIESEKRQGDIFVSPDIAICPECKKEMYDPGDRRYLHPFINCTCCGPRLTILDAMPYDRIRTSMADFPMCDDCAYEYTHAETRRFDAQPVCCNDCGPEVYILDRPERGPDAIRAARRIIKEGGIVGIKGIGGFHLCCDATNEKAVSLLRKRKKRPVKPFAVMMKDLDTVRRECLITQDQEEIADGHQKPILLLPRKRYSPADAAGQDNNLRMDSSGQGSNLGTDSGHQEKNLREDSCRQEKNLRTYSCHQEKNLREDSGHQEKNLSDPRVAPSVARGNPKLGVMLPYAPIHLLLFDYRDGEALSDCLVMTSANTSGAPICRDDDDARRELNGLCDLILSHNRLIRLRADDTVMDFYEGKPYMIRRSRGYAPLPVMTRKKYTGEVLAIGGELKNTFCIGKNQLFYPSPYIGDMEDVRTVRALKESVRRMEELLEVKPSVIACDLHPAYNTTSVAAELAKNLGIPLLPVQHHYAHILSCMAENDYEDPVIGVSFDGTGYGTDGTIWGGEFLQADYDGFTRLGSVKPFLHAGGDIAAKEGWRIAVSLVHSLYGRQRALEIIRDLSVCDEKSAGVIMTMVERGINTITSTSAGRIFDAVSALLGICRASSYEGEASCFLQFAAEHAGSGCAGDMETEPTLDLKTDKKDESACITPSDDDRNFELRTDLIVKYIIEKRLTGEDAGKLAFCFHQMLADAVAEGCLEMKRLTGLPVVALSGGVWQNLLLLRLTCDRLRSEGFKVLTHQLIPPNDGGICLGQAVRAMQYIL